VSFSNSGVFDYWLYGRPYVVSPSPTQSGQFDYWIYGRPLQNVESPATLTETLSAGSFTETGQGLVGTIAATEASGSFTESGQAITGTATANEAAGSFSETGQSITGAATEGLDKGLFSESGQSITGVGAPGLDSGTFVVTGQDLTEDLVAARAFIVGGPKPKKKRKITDPDYWDPEDEKSQDVVVPPDPEYQPITVPADPELDVVDLVWAKPSDPLPYRSRLAKMRATTDEAMRAHRAVRAAQETVARRRVADIMEILNLVEYAEKM
jgi:hypothetical protein